MNDKHDGLWDDILPDTEIQFLARDSERSEARAVLGAVEMIMTSGSGLYNIYA